MSQLEWTNPLPPNRFASAALVDQTELIIKPRSGWIASTGASSWTHASCSISSSARTSRCATSRRSSHRLGGARAGAQRRRLYVHLRRRGWARIKVCMKTSSTYLHFHIAGLHPLFHVAGDHLGGLSLVNQQTCSADLHAAAVHPRLDDRQRAGGYVHFVRRLLRDDEAAGYTPSKPIVLLPLLILLTILMSLGMAFTLSAMTVTYRDLRFLIPFITQIGMWVSAVVFPYKGVGALAKNEWILLFNPLFGIIDSFRSAIFTGWGWRPWHLLASILWTIAILVFGLFYFRKTERRLLHRLRRV